MNKIETDGATLGVMLKAAAEIHAILAEHKLSVGVTTSPMGDEDTVTVVIGSKAGEMAVQPVIVTVKANPEVWTQ